MLRTRLCELLSIDYPVLQGGMAWVADAALASAVSMGGGLGIIAAMNADAQRLREEVGRLRAVTDRPFAVNIMLMSPHVKEVAQAVIDLKVPIVTTGAGNPSPYMAAWLAAGIKVIPVVPSVGVARLVEKRGACAVIAEGTEAGGHVGELTTMVLIPQVSAAVQIPVIAAGGIADGRGAAAAFLLGAQGIQMGTRFLTATECSIHPNYKKRVLAAHDIDTIATGRRLGHPVRALKNPLTMEIARMEFDPGVSKEEMEQRGSGALRLAVQEGDEKEGCFMAGQCAALIEREMPASEIIREVMTDAGERLRQAAQWV